MCIVVHLFEDIRVEHFLIHGEGLCTHLLTGSAVGDDGIVDDDYILTLWPDEYPLIVGERYAMFCCMSDETTEYGMPESFLFHVYPMDRWIDLEGLVSNYGFDLCDEYITVSKQLAALFRHTEHIGESMIK